MATIEDLLERLGRYLSDVLENLEEFLSVVSIRLKAAVRRTGLFILRILRLCLRSAVHLLKLCSIFLALGWIGSGCLELTYYGSWVLKAIGVAGVGFVALVILAGILMFLRPNRSDKDIEKRAYTIHFAFVHLVALGILCAAVYYRYEFRAPILKWVESSLASLSLKTEALLNPQHLPEAYKNQKKRLSGWISSPQPKLEPATLWIPVKSKGNADNEWAAADDKYVRLNMWAETVVLTRENTILNMAVKTWDESSTAELRKADGAYFVDDFGTKYEMSKDEGDYGILNKTHVCTGDEIYRFQLLFPRLSGQSGRIFLHHPQFERLEIDLNWQLAPTVNH